MPVARTSIRRRRCRHVPGPFTGIAHDTPLRAGCWADRRAVGGEPSGGATRIGSGVNRWHGPVVRSAAGSTVSGRPVIAEIMLRSSLRSLPPPPVSPARRRRQGPAPPRPRRAEHRRQHPPRPRGSSVTSEIRSAGRLKSRGTVPAVTSTTCAGFQAAGSIAAAWPRSAP